MIRPGDQGTAVQQLQQALIERGALPPAAQGEEVAQIYGPITQGAVRSFQGAAGLRQDAIVGPATWAALGGADPAPDAVPPPDYAGARGLGGRALALADSELRLRVREVPRGSNRGPRVDEYLTGVDGAASYLLRWRPARQFPDGWQGAPWCGRFARWCFDRASADLGIPSPLADWGDLASAWKWQDEAVRRGAIRSPRQAEPGMAGLIIVPRLGTSEPHGHVVLVAQMLGDSVWTREGNSGDQVAARRRAIGEFAAMVQVG